MIINPHTKMVCRFFLIAMSIVSGYLVLSLPFSIVAIVRPHAAGPRIFLLIMDIVIYQFTYKYMIYIIFLIFSLIIKSEQHHVILDNMLYGVLY